MEVVTKLVVETSVQRGLAEKPYENIAWSKFPYSMYGIERFTGLCQYIEATS
jgi:hypothetical protein